jgi:7-cyano-7-deazaguanine reductase
MKIPQFKIGVLRIPSDSQFIVESKSLKLYFHQFNSHIFNDESEFIAQVSSDLKRILNVDITLTLRDPLNISPSLIDGVCLETVHRNKDALQVAQLNLSEMNMNTVYTHAFRSNCPVTNQPDWATIVIKFSGNTIDLVELLTLLLAYRNENAFHEECMTSIFSDLQTSYSFSKLSIYGAFSRRGGIAIHPFRSNYRDEPNPIFLLKS